MVSYSPDPTDLGDPPQRAEEELPALYAGQGLRVPVPVMLSAVFLAWLASEEAPRWLVVGWPSAVAAVLVIRWRVILAAAHARSVPIMWRMNAIALVSGLGGLVHGQSVLFWPYMDELSRLVQSMLMLGLCAGAVATEFGYLRIVLAYVVPILVPLAFTWAQALGGLHGGRHGGSSVVLVLLVTMYGTLLTVLARDTFSLFRESFESRQRMRRALEHAEAANRAKTRFLASASHDLRQPMHTLSLFAGTLARRPLDPKSQSLVRQINVAMQVLSTELDALLDISKLDAGVVPVNRCDFRLNPLLDRLRDEFLPLANRKRIGLSIEAGAGLACHADPLLLERVLRNLIDNAIKYTRSGRVELRARPHLGKVELVLTDTGPGIPESEQTRVFEEFYQLGNPERDRHQGLGLGLSIVQRLTNLLAIDLQMRSSTGEGTTFVLHVPSGIVQGLASDSAPDAVPSIAGLHVMVIDDEEAVREGMGALLGELGCHVQLTAGSDEAVSLARRQAPDVVLADFRLRERDDGISALRRLRAIDPELPALLVSGDTAPARLREAHAAGLRLLHKPTSPEALARAIREEVDRRPFNQGEQQLAGL